jgi:putative ABC transport system substrate-binding protein
MKRRDVVAFLAGTAFVLLPSARAQQTRLPTIGYLSSNPLDIPVGEVADFKAGLGEAGVIEGRDVAIDYRFTDGNYDRLSAFAAELVNRPVDVIAASGLPATVVAKSATASIPIVFIVGVDPVVHGLVESMRAPSRNVTRVTQVVGALIEKQLQLLHELVPSATSVGFLSNPRNPNAATLNNVLTAAAQGLRLRIVPLSALTQEQIEVAFATGRDRGIEMLLIGGDAFLRAQGRQLVGLAARYAIPTIYEEPEYVVDGGLMSYGTRRSEMRRQAGVYVGRVLRGAKPGELPVMQPTKFELIINLKTAKALGLTVPPALLARADGVIE